MTLELNLQKGLVGHWTMDDADTSGGTLYDKSAYDANVGVPSGVSTGTTSPLGQAYSFDETNSNVLSVGNTNGVFRALSDNNYSVSFWLYPISEDGSTNWPDIFSTPGDGDAWRIEYPQDGLNYVAMYWANAADSNLHMERAYVTANAWNHVVFTVSSSGTSSTTTTYVDGGNKRQSSTGDLVAFNKPNSFNINATPTVTQNLSDIRFYDTVLSDTEVSALYNMRSQRNANI